MRALYCQRCPRCGFTMMYVQRRGSSGGMWVCPVCGSVRHQRLGETGETIEQENNKINERDDVP